ALRKLADTEKYKSFTIPDNVGGRFSVFTPVGLLPIAAAGFDIHKLISGARAAEKACSGKGLDNPANLYAALRNILYRKGKAIELMANYEPSLLYISEWWKQLFGESEGKDKKGIFPASAGFTTDLHSLGQWIQDGKRNIFETVLSIKSPSGKAKILKDPGDLDGLNYLAGKSMDHVNKMALEGTCLAHADGGVPNITISIPSLNEYNLGALLYMFEKAVAVSGYILEVNPFDQPGVETYKKNMFALLGKPGFSEETKKIRKRLG
ncbi:MAG: glucose-6-phosphate isomerase, partial [Fibrobacterota bacterium]